MADVPKKRLLRIDKAASITHGTILFGSAPRLWISDVCIDSREVKKGSLFIALSGKRTDGHDYLDQAVSNGAVCILINRTQSQRIAYLEANAHSVAVIAVEETYTALRELAAYWVSQFPDLVRVAITGSSGKTTTKEMVASILSNIGPTVKNPGNYNSDIGLPLSVFTMNESHEFGVFEMGINHYGEMQRMLDVYSPNISLMTNIGTAHIGMFGSQEAIIREKSRIFHSQIKRGYILEDSSWKPYIEKIRDINLGSFGMKTTAGFSGARTLGLDGWKITYEGIDIHLKHVGTHNLLNALAAIRIAQELGATKFHIQAGLEDVQPMQGRSRVIHGNVTVIEDSYNSNVESASSILDYVNTLDWSGRKAVVLGSIKELGFAERRAHKIMGEKIAQLAPQGTFLYGREMEIAYKLLKGQNYGKDLFYTDEYEELEEHVTSYVHSGDLVLVKGSRSMAMERLVTPLSLVS